MSKSLPRKARVVIVGGGIIGCSIAYHLAKLGWTDVVLLERKRLTCGTTWHAAGLLTTLRSTENATRLAKYTLDLYKQLEAETGQATGVMQVGSLQIASDAVRVEEMRRECAMARCFGVHNEEITPAQVQAMWPLADAGDVLAGFYFPDDARTNPIDTTMALAIGARRLGVQIIENAKVTDVVIDDDVATGVVTDDGAIAADYVVNCTGMWSREFGAKAGVNIPLHAAEHYYLITETLQGMSADLPILRDPGNAAYFREETGKLMLGLFEPVSAPWGLNGIPESFEFDEIPPDWERMLPYVEKAMTRIPSMQDVGIKLFFCGPESFTADHNYILGEAPNLKNFFVATGFNSLGILSGGGAGMVMASWIANGHAPLDVFDIDIRRTHAFQGNEQFLRERVTESLGLGYQYHWPFRQFETARNIKKSALHDRLTAARACFGESAGWERPNWYAPVDVEPKYEYSYGRQNWFEHSAQEHRAVREGVGLFEQSSFSKFLVEGRDAARVMNWISTANVVGPVGMATYTQFLNERGTIEADVTVTRITEDSFLIVTAAFTHTHIYYWLKSQIWAEAHCFISDATMRYGMLNIQGPRSRDLLAALSDTDFRNEAFPFRAMRDIDIGYYRIKALRMTYVGELGWELYIPTEYLQQVYDLIVAKGAEFDLKHCGYHALNSLRIEKAYREWAHDIGADDSPYEAGLMFAADLNKEGGFCGKDALLRLVGQGVPRRRLVQFRLEDPEPMLHHNEPIIVDGKANGFTTSAMYGHTLGGAVALGYLRHDAGVDAEWLAGRKIEIEIGSRLYPAIASLRPMYDPQSKRVRV